MSPVCVFSADDCKEVDLNHSEALSNIPVQDQDGSGTCYAFAGAQILEFEERSRGRKETLSAIDLGLIYSTKEQLLWDRDSLQSGQVKDAISGAVKNGVASRACVDREIRTFTKDTGQTLEQFVTVLETIHSSTNLFVSERKEVVDASKQLRENSYTATCAVQPTLEKILQKGLWNVGVPDALESVINSCVKRRIRLPEYKFTSMNTGNDDEVRNFLNQGLDGKKPLALGICAEILDGTSPHQGLRGIGFPLFRGSNGNLKKCSSHAVMAVARKKINGKCHYLIRNSWGARWKGNGHKCACKTTRKYYDDCSVLEKAAHSIEAKNSSQRDEYMIARKNALDAGAALDRGKLTYERYEKIYETYASSTKKAKIVADEYNKLDIQNQVYVGCWIEGNNLTANITDIGRIE